MGAKVSQGIRRTCGRCFATKEYDSKLKFCRKCGWNPIMKDNNQTKLGGYDEKKAKEGKT